MPKLFILKITEQTSLPNINQFMVQTSSPFYFINPNISGYKISGISDLIVSYTFVNFNNYFFSCSLKYVRLFYRMKQLKNLNGKRYSVSRLHLQLSHFLLLHNVLQLISYANIVSSSVVYSFHYNVYNFSIYYIQQFQRFHNCCSNQSKGEKEMHLNKI